VQEGNIGLVTHFAKCHRRFCADGLRISFQEELDQLEATIQEEGALVLRAIRGALNTLTQGDAELADEVIAFDDDVDSQYFEVEQGIELLLARQTPVASDLRLVLAMLKDNLVRTARWLAAGLLVIALAVMAGALVPRPLWSGDADGDSLTYIVVTAPTNGVLSGSGSNIIYTPNPNFVGGDSLVFKVNDGQMDSNVATNFITVSPVNDAPVAANQAKVTDENIQVSGTVTATAGQFMSVNSISAP